MERGAKNALTVDNEVRNAARRGDASAQYTLSEIEFNRGNKTEALTWLKKSVSQHFPGACYTMATFQIAGVSVPYDATGARTNLTTAAGQGHSDAQLLLSQMLRTGYGGEKNTKLANDVLLRLAKGDHPIALCGMAMLLHVRKQMSTSVEILLERAARIGSHIAAYIQAEKRRDAALSGDAAAREDRIRYLFISARAGNGLAAAELAENDKSIVQDILNRESLPSTADFDVNFQEIQAVLAQEVEYGFDHPEILSSENNILIYRKFLTPLECSYIKAAAAPTIRPSSTINPRTGKLIKNEIRTSSSSNFDPVSRDCFIFAVDQRIAAATGTNVGQGEPLNVLYYRTGEEYKFHYDYLPEGTKEEPDLLKEGGQRKYTFLISMNEEYSGGETFFPKLNITYRGQLGDALMFRNLRENGRPNSLMLHAGMPINRGLKWVASKWIREGKFSLGKPAAY